MSRNKQRESAQAANIFQFTLAGLIIFSLTLIGAAASFVTYKLVASQPPKLAETLRWILKDKTRSVHVGPWGELITRDIDLERPVEYLTEEVANPQPEVWDVQRDERQRRSKALFAKAGLSAGSRLAAAFAEDGVTAEN